MLRDDLVALNLSQQDWELVRDSIRHEVTRWPAEHVVHFTLLRLQNEVSSVCRKPSAYKTVRRNSQ